LKCAGRQGKHRGGRMGRKIRRDGGKDTVQLIDKVERTEGGGGDKREGSRDPVAQKFSIGKP